MPDGIAHPGGIGIRRMRAVDRDHAEHVQVFVENDDLVEPLHDLPLIRNEVGQRDSGGHAVGIHARVGWAAHYLVLLRSGLERGLDRLALAASRAPPKLKNWNCRRRSRFGLPSGMRGALSVEPQAPESGRKI